ncbi:MAG TPA: hypothetical protein VF593_07860 [Chthoniobacteraceae bacterium]|jgi:hypothetical protein
MICAKLIPTLIVVALTGCASRTDGKHQHPSADGRRISMAIPDQGRVNFRVPLGWHIVQTGPPTYVFKKEPHGDVQLHVSYEKADVTPETDPAELHKKKLASLRNPFGSSGNHQMGSERTADGTRALIYLCVSDGEELSAIIPRDGFFVEVGLHTIQNLEHLVLHRPAFLTLLRSHRI